MKPDGTRDSASGNDSVDEDSPADDSFSSEEDNKPKFVPQTEELEKETPKGEEEVNNEVKGEVIDLIESDSNSDCEVNETAAPEVVVISEDEQETKVANPDDSNDVVFVESPKKKAACEDAQSASSSVTKNLRADRVELVGTPEYTNDFLDSFSPTQNPEEASSKVCVDIESDSASEFDPPKVFKEQEFERTGADSFSELNLHGFTDYMASKASGKNVVQQNSESSSESDYEEDNAKIVECVINEGASKLPALSSIDSKEDEVLTSAEMPTSATEKLARSSTPTRPGEAKQKASVSASASTSGEGASVPTTCEGLQKPAEASTSTKPEAEQEASSSAKEQEAQKRKFNSNADDVQAKKQKLHGPESGDKSELPDFIPFEDSSRSEIIHSRECCSGQEFFSVEEAQRTMSDDPAKWKVSDFDQVRVELLSKGRRCFRCGEVGHRYLNCTAFSSTPRCILCAAIEHVEATCPARLCLSCGDSLKDSAASCGMCERVRRVQCHTCSMPGHFARNCPDLWRRYYLTTREGPLNQPEDHALKPAQDRWCSGCGSHGHFEQDCYHYDRTHPPSSLHIHSYDDVYQQQPNVDPGNPGPSHRSTPPNLDNRPSAKKSSKRKEREKSDREHSAGLKPFGAPTLPGLSCKKLSSCFVRIEGVDMAQLFRQRGAHAFKDIMTDFPGCSMMMTNKGRRYSYTLSGPWEAMTRARYEIGALLFNYIAWSRKPDLTKKFDTKEDFTPETLRKYFKLVDSGRNWTKLAESTLKKATSYRQASKTLFKSLPLETVQILIDKTDKLQMALNSLILAKGNTPNTAPSLKILREAARGAEVDQDELKKAYNHIFRNSAVEPINYQSLCCLLSFNGVVKRNFEQKLSLGQELCIKHNLTEYLTRLKNSYLRMMRKFDRCTQRKFKKLHREIVKQANNRERVVFIDAKWEDLPVEEEHLPVEKDQVPSEEEHLPVEQKANKRKQMVAVKTEEEHLPVETKANKRKQMVVVKTEEEHLPVETKAKKRKQMVVVETEEHLPVEKKANKRQEMVVIEAEEHLPVEKSNNQQQMAEVEAAKESNVEMRIGGRWVAL